MFIVKYISGKKHLSLIKRKMIGRGKSGKLCMPKTRFLIYAGIWFAGQRPGAGGLAGEGIFTQTGDADYMVVYPPGRKLNKAKKEAAKICRA